MDINSFRSGVSVLILQFIHAIWIVLFLGLVVACLCILRSLGLWCRHHPSCVNLFCLFMSAPSPTSPMSLSSNSNGSTDMQDIVPPANSATQPPITTLLDGGRLNHPSQPDQPYQPSYSDILKLGVGSDGGSHQCSAQLESSSQLRACLPLGVLPVSASSSKVIPSSLPKDLPSSEELLACCLLGKIWGNLCLYLLSFIILVMNENLLKVILNMWI